MALVVSLVVDKTLARLASFIHDSYPESHLLSAPPLAPWYDFATLLVLSTPESHRPPFRLSPTASPASFSGPSSMGGGGLRCVWVTLRGPCALRFSLFAGSEPFRSII